MAMLSVFPVPGLPLIGAGDDLAALILAAMAKASLSFQDGDVLVVAQKIISKAEGRMVALVDVRPGAEAASLAQQSGKDVALCQLILDEADEVVRTAPNLVIVRNRQGVVLANAGIDASNVADPDEAAKVLLWPLDPDASAGRLRQALQPKGGHLAVIISDSLGRAWRMGTMGTAIGAAGMHPLHDQCGDQDLFGRTLQATVIGMADQIAAAASLVMGEGAEGIPVALVRGAPYQRADAGGMALVIRAPHQDLFR